MAKAALSTLAAAAALLVGAPGGAGAGGPPQTLPLLRQRDLVYVGAFLLPSSSVDRTSFAYGGTALAYNPARHTLFVVGHDWYQRTAEVTIPPAVRSPATAALRRARFVQRFTDATGGTIDRTGGDHNTIGGQLVYRGRLYGTVYVYYDATASQVVSHWVRPGTSLSAGTARGLYQVGRLGAGFVSGYLVEVPPEWRTLLGGPALTGNCCLPIISRTSYGPAAFAFDPADLGAATPVPATPLVHYPADQAAIGDWADSWNPGGGVLFNGTTVVRGAVFPAGTRSVLFLGTQGTGRFCYGAGTADRSLAGKPTSDGSVYCYDPDASSKGTHGYPYAAQVWAYDANDLLAVRRGRKRPWQARPYAVWELELPFGSPAIGGAAYDPRTGRIYVAQQLANGAEPVIHVLATR